MTRISTQQLNGEIAELLAKDLDRSKIDTVKRLYCTFDAYLYPMGCTKPLLDLSPDLMWKMKAKYKKAQQIIDASKS